MDDLKYFRDLHIAIKTLLGGLGLTLKHLWQAKNRRNESYVDQADYFTQDTGRVTLDYPDESLEVPEIGRYKLHNEIDDCIVCDKCAKVCPVDCIDIEAIKSPEVIGKTSDGTAKRLYAAKFDIDMAKCCFCGLCTTVCPTECLTMTPDYDFTVFDITEHNFEFGNMSESEIAEKKKIEEEADAKKAAAKASPKPSGGSPSVKPVFKPKSFKPSIKIPPKKKDGGSDKE
jgi:NADH-quinone oxidoreductase subunit I